MDRLPEQEPVPEPGLRPAPLRRPLRMDQSSGQEHSRQELASERDPALALERVLVPEPDCRTDQQASVPVLVQVPEPDYQMDQQASARALVPAQAQEPDCQTDQLRRAMGQELVPAPVLAQVPEPDHPRTDPSPSAEALALEPELAQALDHQTDRLASEQARASAQVPEPGTLLAASAPVQAPESESFRSTSSPPTTCCSSASASWPQALP